jgi:sterol desaturase/sphingolipid hydroxylase (fatty acid hydroxylase superfamily)
MVNYIAVAIPVFFVLIGVEFVVARWQGKQVYRFHDTVTDLSCGIGQQVTGLFMKAVFFAGYLWVWNNFALIEMSASSPWTWVVALAGVDFFYYWWHRASHVVNFMWASHIVHHQSEDMNFAVALRQAWFTSATSWIFYLPLAVVGVPPYVFLAADAISTLYQFWIHTETVGKLGPLEWVLNTPSHHRVHHAINPHYLERNYGAMLIVWDRLFNSFQIENVAPVYGILQPLQSWNPIWANFHYWREIWRRARAAPTWRDKIAVWFADPGWDPATHEYQPAPDVDRDAYRKFETRVPRGLNAYVAVQFIPIAAATFALVMWQDQIGRPLALAGAVAVLASVLIWGGLFELKAWAPPLEITRLAGVSLAAIVAAESAWIPAQAAAVTVVGAIVLAVWLLRYRGVFAEFAPGMAEPRSEGPD